MSCVCLDEKGPAFQVSRMRLGTWPLLLILVIFAAGCGEQTANSGSDIVLTPTAPPTVAPSPTATLKPGTKLTGTLHACDPVDSRIA
jgi:hypothetical protein